MNRSSCLALSVAVAFAFGVSSATADSRENQRLQQGKITKNEAQHLVLKKFPGAKVRKCELKGEQGHSIWMLEVMKSGESKPMQVQVDGRTGKISP